MSTINMDINMDINIDLQLQNDSLKKDLLNSNQLATYMEGMIEKQKDEIGRLHSKIKLLETEIEEYKKKENQYTSPFEYLKSFIKY